MRECRAHARDDNSSAMLPPMFGTSLGASGTRFRCGVLVHIVVILQSILPADRGRCSGSDRCYVPVLTVSTLYLLKYCIASSRYRYESLRAQSGDEETFMVFYGPGNNKRLMAMRRLEGGVVRR